jgi:hypothetical protein
MTASGAKRPLVLPRDSVTIKSGRSVQLGRTNEGKQTQLSVADDVSVPIEAV